MSNIFQIAIAVGDCYGSVFGSTVACPTLVASFVLLGHGQFLPFVRTRRGDTHHLRQSVFLAFSTPLVFLGVRPFSKMTDSSKRHALG
jgi:hypothetical protein